MRKTIFHIKCSSLCHLILSVVLHFTSFYFVLYAAFTINWAASLLLFDDPFKMFLHHHSLPYMSFDT